MNELLYFAYANSPEDPLKNLTLEDSLVNAQLSERANMDDDYNIHRESYATTTNITRTLARFRDKICLFHFSGHAGNDELVLEDQEANADGIGQLLLQCPNLHLVMLNGCSTIGHVKTLLNEEGEKGIPVVIATSRSVDDKLATKFAELFYQQLANFDNIEKAFDAAIAGLKLTKDLPYDKGTNRGIYNKRKKKLNEPIWGLYARHDDITHFEWKLPAKGIKPKYIDFTPNKPLFKGLFLELAHYKKEIFDLLSQENKLRVRLSSIPEKNILVLKSLPHTISEQLRKLLASDNGENTGVFYNKLSLHRLDQLLWTYQASIKLVVFTLLAQFWDLRKDNPDSKTLIAKEKKILKSIFTPHEAMGGNYTYEQLIQFLMTTINEHKGPIFMTELKEEKFQFHTNIDFQKACGFLDDKMGNLQDDDFRKKLNNNFNEIQRLCKEVEENLVTVLLKVIFLANYRLASIKEINVRKKRSLEAPQFLHQVIDLEHSILNDFSLGTEIMEEFMDSSSVILSRCKEEQLGNSKNTKAEKHSFYLNLSPFVIDRNAYNKDAAIAKILFFESYMKSDNVLIYNHIYNSNEEATIFSKSKQDSTTDEDFEDIHAQIEAFEKLVAARKP